VDTTNSSAHAHTTTTTAPATRAGDPFAYAGDHPHACMDGWVFLGFEDEDGEEHIECVPCRRCRPETR
jgi:hypothetical protein